MESVRASLRYLVPSEEKPVYVASVGGELAPPDAPPRESIESRLMVFFDV